MGNRDFTEFVILLYYSERPSTWPFVMVRTQPVRTATVSMQSYTSEMATGNLP